MVQTVGAIPGSTRDTGWLIGLAHRWDFPDVDERTMQTFRSEGLLPTPEIVGRDPMDRRRPIREYPEDAAECLAQILYWRGIIKRDDPSSTDLYDQLRLVIWMLGFDVEPTRVRESLVRALTKQMAFLDSALSSAARKRGLKGQGAGWQKQALALLAERAARQRRFAMPIPWPTPLRDRVEALSGMLHMYCYGTPFSDTEAHADVIERTIGISPLGRTRNLGGGVGAWLTGKASDFFETAELWSHPALLNAAVTATDEELERARLATKAFFLYLPMLVRSASALLRTRNPIGWGMLGKMDDHPEYLVMLLPLMINAQRKGWHDNISLVTAALQEAPDLDAKATAVAALGEAEFKMNLARIAKRDRARTVRARKAAQAGDVLLKGPRRVVGQRS